MFLRKLTPQLAAAFVKTLSPDQFFLAFSSKPETPSRGCEDDRTVLKEIAHKHSVTKNGRRDVTQEKGVNAWRGKLSC